MAAVSRFDGQLRWLHKVRLYPTRAQERKLYEMLRVTRELYNAMLFQRRDSWSTRGVAYTSKQQYAEITELRASEPRFAAVYRDCEDATLHRLDLNFAAFFRRIKSGETPGYPRFKSARRWTSLNSRTAIAHCPCAAISSACVSPALGQFDSARVARSRTSAAPLS
jgi:hypothetical protein